MAILRRSIADFDIGGDGVLAPLLASCAVALACAGSAEATKPLVGHAGLIYGASANVYTVKHTVGQADISLTSTAVADVVKPISASASAEFTHSAVLATINNLYGTCDIRVYCTEITKPLGANAQFSINGFTNAGVVKSLAGESLYRFNHLSLKLRVMPVSGFGYSARVIYVGGEQRLVRVPQR